MSVSVCRYQIPLKLILLPNDSSHCRNEDGANLSVSPSQLFLMAFTTRLLIDWSSECAQRLHRSYIRIQSVISSQTKEFISCVELLVS